ncbi:CASP-like protein 1C2 [Senna tora]|uniref:CASP-like protein 1C2 n=1 Tax=Senna tora TaxID=362788 RepID=A0A834X9E3_9FABA|nr:CASP-like protein 1C2 [Senna tora]
MRLLASLATFCAAMVMLFAHQTAIFVDSSIHVNFGDLAAYW